MGGLSPFELACNACSCLSGSTLANFLKPIEVWVTHKSDGFSSNGLLPRYTSQWRSAFRGSCSCRFGNEALEDKQNGKERSHCHPFCSSSRAESYPSLTLRLLGSSPFFDSDRVSSPNRPMSYHTGVDPHVDLVVLGRSPQNTGITGQVSLRQRRHDTARAWAGDREAHLIADGERMSNPGVLHEARNLRFRSARRCWGESGAPRSALLDTVPAAGPG